MTTRRDQVPAVSVREANERLSNPEGDAILLDVRETDEYAPRRGGAR